MHKYNSLTGVINNNKTIIPVVISDNNNSSNVSFAQSIASTLSVHNVDKTAHENIIPTKVSELANDSGFLTDENEPVFKASVAKNIATGDVANWNTASANSHLHGNKTLLDSLTASGNGKSFLANDGNYKIMDTSSVANTSLSNLTNTASTSLKTAGMSTVVNTYVHGTS